MKKIFLSLICISFIQIIFCQTDSQLLSVQLSVRTQSTPDSNITIDWLNDGTATSYVIYKRLNTEDDWLLLDTLSNSESSYRDSDVSIGTAYEYRVIKQGSRTGYGYINAGINLPVKVNNGILILVVENTYVGNTNFDNAINQTIKDIENDGWMVERINVNRNDEVSSVKNSIISIYNQSPKDTKAVYIIGHVPVPYSGLINPDGHPDHRGAWSTDLFYSDIDGNWTDNVVNDNSAWQTRNQNTIGDGKYDQNTIETSELQIGRVDFNDMPTFTETEEQLLINYLNKAHSYKIREFDAQERAIVYDNFQYLPYGFASNGYTNFSTMFTPSNISDNIDIINSTRAESYMWIYGCGPGSYTSCSGVGNTQDFASGSLKSIFMMLFGSYFGDWDSTDNYLRAAIAQGQTLNSFWAGWPNWQLHHMSLGSNIGYSALLTQNNSGDYFSDYKKYIHISLMGDPTIRMYYISPPINLLALQNNNTIELSWTASTDEVLGYNIYRLEENSFSYVKINDNIITETTFTDNTHNPEISNTYIIKSVNLKTTASGSFYNQSLGIRKDIAASTTLKLTNFDPNKIALYPNPTSDVIQIKLDKNEFQVKTTLTNNLGQIIFSKIYNSTNKFSFKIDAPKGLYFLKLETSNNEIFIKKIIKK